MSGRNRIARNIARVIACCALFAPLVGAADPAGAFRSGDAAPHYRRTELRFQVPDAILTDPWGKSFSLAQELGAEGPVAINFFSTAGCGDDCAGVNRVFADLRGRTGPKLRNLRMISILIDPRQHTPARLRAYAKQVGAGNSWILLTGSRREIEPVLRAFGTDAGGAGSTTFLHAGPKAAWVRLDGSVSAADLVTELH